MKFTFRTFSMQDSQDFQCFTPRIFNLVRFFDLSIIMRNFVELSDILQNAATGVNCFFSRIITQQYEYKTYSITFSGSVHCHCRGLLAGNDSKTR